MKTIVFPTLSGVRGSHQYVQGIHEQGGLHGTGVVLSVSMLGSGRSLLCSVLEWVVGPIHWDSTGGTVLSPCFDNPVLNCYIANTAVIFLLLKSPKAGLQSDAWLSFEITKDRMPIL